MDRDEIVDVVMSVLLGIAPEADPAHLDPEVELREQIDFDSMDFLTFVDALHQATGIEVPERDYPRISTIAGCTRYLADRIVAAASTEHPVS
jgi:acyl carrier protein